MKRTIQHAIRLYSSNKLDEAEALLRQLHSVASLRSDASYGLGLVAFRRHLPDEAFGWFSMVPTDSAHFADGRYYMAAIERQRGMIAAAVRFCNESLMKEPSHRWALGLAAELRHSPPQSPGVAMPGPRAPSGRLGGPPLETDLWLPNEDEELEDYAKRKLAKERINYKVDTWLKYPLWQRALMILMLILFFAMFLRTMSMAAF